MSVTALFVFGLALFVAAASPGPAITALVARVLARGTVGALAYMFGLAIGDVFWLTVAVLGLAFIAKSFALLFLLLKYAGAAYLLYLAYRMWTARAETRPPEEFAAERPFRLFLTALSVMLGNPKVMVFYLALLPKPDRPRARFRPRLHGACGRHFARRDGGRRRLRPDGVAGDGGSSRARGRSAA